MSQRGFVAGLLLLMTAVAPLAADQGVFRKLFKRGGVEFKVFDALKSVFTMQYPSRDWQAVSGGGSVLVSFAQRKSEATVVVERISLRQALNADDVTDIFVAIEKDEILKRTPAAVISAATVVETGARRVVVVDFSRPGITGVETVRQYSMVEGMQLFRVVCSAQSAHFAKYEPIFSHMAQSFAARQAVQATP